MGFDHTDTLVVRVALGADQVDLRFTPDPGETLRAFVRGRGYAVDHGRRPVPPSLSPLMVELRRRLPADEDHGRSILEWMTDLARRAAPGVSVTLWRVERAGVKAPGIQHGLRRGAPRRDALLPVDVEWAALRLGLRRLVKREGLARTEAEHAAREAAAVGVHAIVVGPPEPGAQVSLLLAMDDSLLRDAAARERVLAEPGPRGHAEAEAAWMGEALGYPACCIQRFVSIHRWDDLSLMRELLPLTPLPAAAVGLWLPAELSLLSHAPCRVDCEASERLGLAILAGLDAQQPGYGARWLQAAARAVLVTDAGSVWLVEGDGPLDGLVVRSTLSVPDLVAEELCWPAQDEPRPERGDVLRLGTVGWTLCREGRAAERISAVLDYRTGGPQLTAGARTR